MLLILKQTTDARFKSPTERPDERFLSIDFNYDEQRCGFDRGRLRVASWWKGVRRFQDWQIGTILTREKAVELAHVIARDFEECGGRVKWQPPSLEEIERRTG